MGDQIRIPRVVITFCYSYFPFLFQGGLQNCHPCVMSFFSICQVFVLHFAMAVFMCMNLRYRVLEERENVSLFRLQAREIDIFREDCNLAAPVSFF